MKLRPGLARSSSKALLCRLGDSVSIDEGEEIIDEYEDSPALDAGLIGAAQAVEHYEIARYGTLKAWAKELGLDEAVSLLDATLAEEESTDEKLSNLAESAINQRAEAAA
jgi:ferritin-like metal-binding protein YciE